ncbi:MAG: DUF1501 domain-containing protein [Planctomycetaceae bacterium]
MSSDAPPPPAACLPRRRLLAGASMGFGSVALGALAGAAEASARPRRVRSVIFLFMSGGVSAVDSFDPKPRLARDHGKPMPVPVKPTMFNANGTIFASPWAFRNRGESGLPVSDLFPGMARHADRLAVIRSLTSPANEHAQANFHLHSGFSTAGHPSAGAWVSYGLGTECHELPGYVVLAGGGVPLGGAGMYSSAFLPASHTATLLDPAGGEALPNLRPRESAGRQRAIVDLVATLGRRRAHAGGDEAAAEAVIGAYEAAARMQAAVPGIVDLSAETPETLALYGVDAPVAETAGYARQCLLARRLVERGVRFIELTCLPRPADPGQIGNPWDQHGGLAAGHAEMAAQVDRPIAGLLEDLHRRGLLEETLVVWSGEFGRTPFAQGSDGRDHNPYGFSAWIAGGGVRGGTAFGATDDLGYHAVEHPVTVHDLWATVLCLMGVDHERLTFRHGGRDHRLSDVHGRPIRAVIA